MWLFYFFQTITSYYWDDYFISLQIIYHHKLSLEYRYDCFYYNTHHHKLLQRSLYDYFYYNTHHHNLLQRWHNALHSCFTLFIKRAFTSLTHNKNWNIQSMKHTMNQQTNQLQLLTSFIQNCLIMRTMVMPDQ